jgi:hypothetical protein
MMAGTAWRARDARPASGLRDEGQLTESTQPTTVPQVSRRLASSGQLLATSLVLSLLLAPGASAAIVVGQGIAGVGLFSSQSRVVRALGKPSSTLGSWGYGEPLDGRITFAHGRVVDVWTHSLHQRTGRGIGRGSSVSATQHAYRVRCHNSNIGWTLICAMRTRYRHRPVVTTFYFSGTLSVVDISAG